MISIIYRKTFRQAVKRLSGNEILLMKETIELFMEDPFHPSLRNYPLDAYWSITVESDLRIIYRKRDDETVIFYTIGTHHEV